MRKDEEFDIRPSSDDQQPFEIKYNSTVIEDYPGATGVPFSPRPAKDRVVTYNKTNEMDY